MYIHIDVLLNQLGSLDLHFELNTTSAIITYHHNMTNMFKHKPTSVSSKSRAESVFQYRVFKQMSSPQVCFQSIERVFVLTTVEL